MRNPRNTHWGGGKLEESAFVSFDSFTRDSPTHFPHCPCRSTRRWGCEVASCSISCWCWKRTRCCVCYPVACEAYTAVKVLRLVQHMHGKYPLQFWRCWCPPRYVELGSYRAHDISRSDLRPIPHFKPNRSLASLDFRDLSSSERSAPDTTSSPMSVYIISVAQ